VEAESLIALLFLKTGLGAIQSVGVAHGLARVTPSRPHPSTLASTGVVAGLWDVSHGPRPRGSAVYLELQLADADRTLLRGMGGGAVGDIHLPQAMGGLPPIQHRHEGPRFKANRVDKVSWSPCQENGRGA